jgi:hypothetical protein
MIAWCDGVRAEVKARSAREKAEAAAAAARVDMSPQRSVPPPQPALQTPQNAIDHAKHQHEIAVSMLAEFSEQHDRLVERIAEVRENIRIWSAVIAQFSKAADMEADND